MIDSGQFVAPLFEPFQINKLTLRNRIVMPPMGFHTSDNGAPGPDVAEYYRLRARGGAGLILTEGAFIDHPTARDLPLFLSIDTEETLIAWKEVVRQIHSAGSLCMPELWHAGLKFPDDDLLKSWEAVYDPAKGLVGPSGHIMPGRQVTEPMSQAVIDDIIDAYARTAVNVKNIGFDGVHLHGAHGYLIDQFFWSELNRRDDGYGGSMRNRARFAAEIIAEIRRRVGPDYPIVIRISQWKVQDYDAKVARTPAELEDWVTPLVDAGIDVFDCSQRRYWQPEFEGSDLNFGGWVKKITGKPTISCGSVGLSTDLIASISGAQDGEPVGIERLGGLLERGDFDLIAVGRALYADPEWPEKIRTGRVDDLLPFKVKILAESPSHANLAE